MTTARSLSSDEVARLPCCQHIIAAKGLTSKYVGDCIVRAYQSRTLGDLIADLNTGPASNGVTIHAGIGTLTMTSHGNQFAPVVSPSTISNALDATGRMITAMVTGARVMVTEEQRQARLATCATCPEWDADRGKCTACGCWTAAKASLATEDCPKGKWPKFRGARSRTRT